MAIATISSNLGLFHIDEALSQFALGYAQSADAFIADKIAPPLMVDKQSDVYYIGGTEHLQKVDAARGPGGTFKNVSFAVSEDTYNCKFYGLQNSMPWELPANADAAIDPVQEAITEIVDLLMLRSEVAVASVMTTGGNWTGSGACLGTWRTLTSGVSDHDPVLDIEAAKTTVVDNCGHLPNTMFMNYPQWVTLRNNTFIKARVLNTMPGALGTPALVASLLDLDQVLVAKAVYATSEVDATPTMDYVWPTGTVGLAYIDNRVGPLRSKVMTPARQFVWTVMGGRFASRSFPFDPTMSTVAQVVDYVDEKVCVAGACTLLTGCNA